MNYKYFIITLVIIGSITITSSFVYAQSDTIPIWIKNTALWYGQDEINDDEFFSLIQFLIDRQIITVPDNNNDSNIVNQLKNENQKLQNEISTLKRTITTDISNAYNDGYNNGLAENLTQTQQREFTLTVETNKLSYTGIEEIILSGTMFGTGVDTPIVYMVKSPGNTIIDKGQFSINGGYYSTSLYTNPETYNTTGQYTIEVIVGHLKSTTEFQFTFIDSTIQESLHKDNSQPNQNNLSCGNILYGTKTSSIDVNIINVDKYGYFNVNGTIHDHVKGNAESHILYPDGERSLFDIVNVDNDGTFEFRKRIDNMHKFETNENRIEVLNIPDWQTGIYTLIVNYEQTCNLATFDPSIFK